MAEQDQDAGYNYAIESYTYRFSEYVGLRAEVSEVGKKLAVKKVTHFRLPPDR
jgi:hypothetical protein